jgi:hypothetical protein
MGLGRWRALKTRHPYPKPSEKEKLSKNKKFFFEKKNQKTFAPLREGVKQEGLNC